MSHQASAQRATLAEPVVIASWWKNRRKDAIRVRLNSFEGHTLIDIRTWYGEDGKLKPGKGFAATVQHLPRLAAELTKAVAKARELGLIPDGATDE